MVLVYLTSDRIDELDENDSTCFTLDAQQRAAMTDREL